MANFDYRPGCFVDSVVADQKFEDHLRRLAETRRMMIERKAENGKCAPRPTV